jgi:hypothetical protein
MDRSLNAILLVCIIGFVGLSARWARATGEWASFWTSVLPLSAFVLFLNRWFGFPSPNSVVQKAADHDVLLAGVMFLCMVVGMLFRHLHEFFGSPARRRKRWDWGCFLAPVFASPIMFLPLAAAFQNVEIDLTNPRLKLPQLMVFFVAFQNGYFWKEHYDHKLKLAEKNR